MSGLTSLGGNPSDDKSIHLPHASQHSNANPVEISSEESAQSALSKLKASLQSPPNPNIKAIKLEQKGEGSLEVDTFAKGSEIFSLGDENSNSFSIPSHITSLFSRLYNDAKSEIFSHLNPAELAIMKSVARSDNAIITSRYELTIIITKLLLPLFRNENFPSTLKTLIALQSNIEERKKILRFLSEKADTGYTPVNTFEHILYEQIQIKDYIGAIQTAKISFKLVPVNSAFEFIAMQQVMENDFDGAQATIRDLKKDSFISTNILDLIKAKKAINDFRNLQQSSSIAFELINQLKGEKAKITLLIELATLIAKKNPKEAITIFEAARAVAEEEFISDEKYTFFKEIVIAQMKTDSIGASQTLILASDTVKSLAVSKRDLAYQEIIAFQMELGDLPNAENNIEHMDDQEAQAKAYLTIALKYKQLNQIENFQKILSLLKPIIDRINDLNVCFEFTKQINELENSNLSVNEIEEILTQVNSTQNPEIKIELLMRIVTSQAQGQNEECYSNLKLVFDVINDMKAPNEQVAILQMVLLTLTNLDVEKFKKEIKTILESLNNSPLKTDRLMHSFIIIAIAHAKIGEIDEALLAANQIRNDKIKQMVYLEIADQLIKKEKFEDAKFILRQASQIEFDSQDIKKIKTIVIQQIQLQDFDGAKQILNTLNKNSNFDEKQYVEIYELFFKVYVEERKIDPLAAQQTLTYLQKFFDPKDQFDSSHNVFKSNKNALNWYFDDENQDSLPLDGNGNFEDKFDHEEDFL